MALRRKVPSKVGRLTGGGVGSDRRTGAPRGVEQSAMDALGPRAEAMRATAMFDPAEWVIRE